MELDERAYLSGKITASELRQRTQARAAGAAFGATSAAIVIAVGPTTVAKEVGQEVVSQATGIDLSLVPSVKNLAKGGVEKLVKSRVDDVADSALKLLPSPRQHLLDSATDSKLISRIDKLYRANAKVGNGSTADAIRHELSTGELLSPAGHVQKGIEMRNGLMNDIKSGRLNDADAAIARGLVKDLQNALSGQ